MVAAAQTAPAGGARATTAPAATVRQPVPLAIPPGKVAVPQTELPLSVKTAERAVAETIAQTSTPARTLSPAASNVAPPAQARVIPGVPATTLSPSQAQAVAQQQAAAQQQAQQQAVNQRQAQQQAAQEARRQQAAQAAASGDLNALQRQVGALIDQVGQQAAVINSLQATLAQFGEIASANFAEIDGKLGEFAKAIETVNAKAEKSLAQVKVLTPKWRQGKGPFAGRPQGAAPQVVAPEDAEFDEDSV